MASCNIFLCSVIFVVALVNLTQVDATLPPECRLPADVGWCRAAMTMYFFNMDTMTCEEFIYGGCHGNDNNFDTLEACQRRCMLGDGNNNNNNNNNNVIFTYNHNDECQRPLEAGWCGQSFQRFYYNTAQRACLNFTYGGCLANGNNFITQERCEERCAGNTNDYGNYDNSNICMFEPDTGPCRGLSRLYYYDRHIGHCRTFTYGLCGGNANKFPSLASCQARCGESGIIGGSYPSYRLFPRPFPEFPTVTRRPFRGNILRRGGAA